MGGEEGASQASPEQEQQPVNTTEESSNNNNNTTTNEGRRQSTSTGQQEAHDEKDPPIPGLIPEKKQQQDEQKKEGGSAEGQQQGTAGEAPPKPGDDGSVIKTEGATPGKPVPLDASTNSVAKSEALSPLSPSGDGVRKCIRNQSTFKPLKTLRKHMENRQVNEIIELLSKVTKQELVEDVMTLNAQGVENIGLLHQASFSDIPGKRNPVKITRQMHSCIWIAAIVESLYPGYINMIGSPGSKSTLLHGVGFGGRLQTLAWLCILGAIPHGVNSFTDTPLTDCVISAPTFGSKSMGGKIMKLFGSYYHHFVGRRMDPKQPPHVSDEENLIPGIWLTKGNYLADLVAQKVEGITPRHWQAAVAAVFPEKEIVPEVLENIAKFPWKDQTHKETLAAILDPSKMASGGGTIDGSDAADWVEDDDGWTPLHWKVIGFVEKYFADRGVKSDVNEWHSVKATTSKASLFVAQGDDEVRKVKKTDKGVSEWNSFIGSIKDLNRFLRLSMDKRIFDSETLEGWWTITHHNKRFGFWLENQKLRSFENGHFQYRGLSQRWVRGEKAKLTTPPNSYDFNVVDAKEVDVAAITLEMEGTILEVYNPEWINFQFDGMNAPVALRTHLLTLTETGENLAIALQNGAANPVYVTVTVSGLWPSSPRAATVGFSGNSGLFVVANCNLYTAREEHDDGHPPNSFSTISGEDFNAGLIFGAHSDKQLLHLQRESHPRTFNMLHWLAKIGDPHLLAPVVKSASLDLWLEQSPQYQTPLTIAMMTSKSYQYDSVKVTPFGQVIERFSSEVERISASLKRFNTNPANLDTCVLFRIFHNFGISGVEEVIKMVNNRAKNHQLRLLSLVNTACSTGDLRTLKQVIPFFPATEIGWESIDPARAKSMENVNTTRDSLSSEMFRGASPFSVAAARGHIGIIKALIAAGASPLEYHGRILWYALRGHHMQVADYLVEHHDFQSTACFSSAHPDASTSVKLGGDKDILLSAVPRGCPPLDEVRFFSTHNLFGGGYSNIALMSQKLWFNPDSTEERPVLGHLINAAESDLSILVTKDHMKFNSHFPQTTRGGELFLQICSALQTPMSRVIKTKIRIGDIEILPEEFSQTKYPFHFLLERAVSNIGSLSKYFREVVTVHTRKYSRGEAMMTLLDIQLVPTECKLEFPYIHDLFRIQKDGMATPHEEQRSEALHFARTLPSGKIVSGKMSRIAKISLDQLLGVNLVNRAKYFAYLYPCGNTQTEDEYYFGHSDLEEAFSIYGGYVYFDVRGNFCNSLAVVPTVKMGHGSLKSTFDGPIPMDQKSAEVLEIWDRWVPVTLNAPLDIGAVQFCWMNPAEHIGLNLQAPIPHGGFAYTFQKTDKKTGKTESHYAYFILKEDLTLSKKHEQIHLKMAVAVAEYMNASMNLERSLEDKDFGDFISKAFRAAPHPAARLFSTLDNFGFDGCPPIQLAVRLHYDELLKAMTGPPNFGLRKYREVVQDIPGMAKESVVLLDMIEDLWTTKEIESGLLAEAVQLVHYPEDDYAYTPTINYDFDEFDDDDVAGVKDWKSIWCGDGTNGAENTSFGLAGTQSMSFAVDAAPLPTLGQQVAGILSVLRLRDVLIYGFELTYSIDDDKPILLWNFPNESRSTKFRISEVGFVNKLARNPLTWDTFKEVLFFAFIYPYDGGETLKGKQEEIMHGGYVYFDNTMKPIQLRGFLIGKPQLHFSGPFRLQPTRHDHSLEDRMVSVTLPALLDLGVESFTWMYPNEHIGRDLNGPCPHGGFCYKVKKNGITTYAYYALLSHAVEWDPRKPESMRPQPKRKAVVDILLEASTKQRWCSLEDPTIVYQTKPYTAHIDRFGIFTRAGRQDPTVMCLLMQYGLIDLCKKYRLFYIEPFTIKGKNLRDVIRKTRENRIGLVIPSNVCECGGRHNFRMEDNGLSLIAWCCLYDDLELLKFHFTRARGLFWDLSGNGITVDDIFKTRELHYHPIHLAAYMGATDSLHHFVTMLKDLGNMDYLNIPAEAHINDRKDDDFEPTPIFLSAALSREEAVKLLFDAGGSALTKVRVPTRADEGNVLTVDGHNILDAHDVVIAYTARNTYQPSSGNILENMQEQEEIQGKLQVIAWKAVAFEVSVLVLFALCVFLYFKMFFSDSAFTYHSSDDYWDVVALQNELFGEDYLGMGAIGDVEAWMTGALASFLTANSSIFFPVGAAAMGKILVAPGTCGAQPGQVQNCYGDTHQTLVPPLPWAKWPFSKKQVTAYQTFRSYDYTDAHWTQLQGSVDTLTKLSPENINGWLEPATRGVFVLMTIYIAPIQKTAVIECLMEVLQTGNVVPQQETVIVRTSMYQTSTDKARILIEVLLLFFMVYSLIAPLYKMRVWDLHGSPLHILRTLFRRLDKRSAAYLIYFVLMLGKIGVHGTLITETQNLPPLADMIAQPWVLFDVSKLAASMVASRALSASLMGLISLGVMNALVIAPQVGPTVAAILYTISNLELLIFFGLFLILVLACALVFWGLFRPFMAEFHDLPSALLSAYFEVTQDFFGDDLMRPVYPNFTPILLIGISIVIKLIFLNILIAVLGNIYADMLEQRSITWWYKTITNIHRESNMRMDVPDDNEEEEDDNEGGEEKEEEKEEEK